MEDNLSPVDLAEMIGQPYKKRGNYVQISCYNTTAHKHGDKNPSLTIYGFDKGYFCYACSESGSNSWLLKQFGVKGNHVPNKINNPKKTPKQDTKNYKTYPLAKIWKTLPRLPESVRLGLEEKGFYGDQFEDFAGWRWHTNQIDGWGEGIFMPYTFRGTMVSARLRRISGEPRFLSLPGAKSWPYCLDKVRYPRVYVTEGCTDCLTLNFIGIPAIGIPGSTNTEAMRTLFIEAESYGCQLVAIPDNDPAGQSFLERLYKLAYEYHISLEVFRVPYGKDVNEWYCKASHYEIEDILMKHARQDDIEPKVKLINDDWLDDVMGMPT